MQKYKVVDLGILDAQGLINIYKGSHLEINIPQTVWERIVTSLHAMFPHWTLFTENMYCTTLNGVSYYFQRNAITIPYDTGITLLASELFSDFVIDLDEKDVVGILQVVYQDVQQGLSLTNVVVPNAQCDKFLYDSTEMILLNPGDTFDHYLTTLTSKKRNSIKGSLKKASGFKYTQVTEFSTQETVWILSRLLHNFADIGVGLDGMFGVDYAQAQWIPILSEASSTDYKVFRVLDADDRIVGFVGYVARKPLSIGGYADREIWDFTSFVQDRSYLGVGSAMLIETTHLLLGIVQKPISIMLATAQPPGCEFNYFQYKRNCSNYSQEVISALATHADTDRVFPCSFDSKNKVWV
jgi:hypothetical protein